MRTQLFLAFSTAACLMVANMAVAEEVGSDTTEAQSETANSAAFSTGSSMDPNAGSNEWRRNSRARPTEREGATSGRSDSSGRSGGNDSGGGSDGGGGDSGGVD